MNYTISGYAGKWRIKDGLNYLDHVFKTKSDANLVIALLNMGNSFEEAIKKAGVK
jgi:poly-gamma-glutamate capsule biosynthesis protein CapA/YwtB (metallophosphatase superfamily)